MRKIMLLLALAFACAVPAFAEMADPPMRGYGRADGQMMEMGNMDRMGTMMDMCVAHVDRLGLSDEQLMKIKPLHREMQKKQARFKADLKIAEIDLREIMDVKDFDLDKANAAVKKISEIKTAHHLDMLKSMKEMRSILTEEQFRKMQKMMPMNAAMKKPARKMMKKQP